MGVGETKPVVTGRIVDGHEYVMPLNHAGQSVISPPKIRTLGIICTHVAGMVDKHNSLGI